jgi:para-nitrobenzyl esterase
MAQEIFETLRPSTGAFVQSAYRLWPIVDGHFLRDQAGQVLTRGEHNHVPTMGGSNANEVGLWRAQSWRPTLRALHQTEGSWLLAYEAALLGVYFRADKVARIVAQYPLAEDTEAATVPTLERVITDSNFVCSTRRYARALAEVEPKTWLYRFSRNPIAAGPASLGAFHGLEMQYLFGNHDADHGALFAESPTPDDEALSAAMMGYWTRFAATGDPNGPGTVTWPAYHAGGDAKTTLE